MTCKVNDVAKLLDNGWHILIFRNALDSYTARAIRPLIEGDGGTVNEVVDTDDFTPGDALYRLAEKASTGRIGHIDKAAEAEEETS